MVTTGVVLTNANTEYEFTVLANTVWMTMQARTAVDFRVAHQTGIVATPTETAGQVQYATVKSGAGLTLQFAPKPIAQTLYLACGSAGIKVEIIY